MTSKLGRWRLKWPASRLFTQLFIEEQIKENIKAPRHCPLCGEFTGDKKHCVAWWRHQIETLSALVAFCAVNSPVTGEFTAQKDANAEPDKRTLTRKMFQFDDVIIVFLNAVTVVAVRNDNNNTPNIPNNKPPTWPVLAVQRLSQQRTVSLQWRHNERHGVANHQPYDCLLNLLFRRRSNKTSKLCVTGLWGEFDRWIPRTKG